MTQLPVPLRTGQGVWTVGPDGTTIRNTEFYNYLDGRRDYSFADYPVNQILFSADWGSETVVQSAWPEDATPAEDVAASA